MVSNTLLVVTGASRGIGRSIANAVSKRIQCPHRCRAVLIARSEPDLAKTKNFMRTGGNDNIEIESVATDLSDLDAVELVIPELFRRLAMTSYDHAILINNAGSFGYLGPSTSIDLRGLQHALNLNVTSSIYISSQFTSHFSDFSKKTTIVNISSVAAIKPFPTLGAYCAGKAARDMFHSVMAEEMKDKKCVNVINYAPGAVETDMQAEIRGSETIDDMVKGQMTKMKEEGSLLDSDETARVLNQLIFGDTDVKSGNHIDYWDVKG
uniref:Sepiapterin reductase n=1 Tax=Corethron hystrix TaxID=216773 RepID=A0A7S1BEA8_9STRA|mmetsp:Transcript_22773/g.52171  ORF Transcript_22773/g.52171 Transcript_22773/m.52171 type:complete len:266 (+) Transcript_22773:159-956(+)